MAALRQFAIRDHKTHRLLKPSVKFRANSVCPNLKLVFVELDSLREDMDVSFFISLFFHFDTFNFGYSGRGILVPYFQFKHSLVYLR